tara:strand:+ start:1512 stop:2843 length:1332 start_codon:yes stop_codon:yes gene_type:complete
MSQGYSSHQEIVPSNITADGKLSYYNGQPTVQFLLGEQDRYIKPGSIRLVGEFTVWSDADGATLPTLADDIRMNERLGVNAIIDQLTVFSQKSGQVMETINHHNRMMSSYLSVTQSMDDFAGHTYETSLRFPNGKGQQIGVLTNSQAAFPTGKNEFCVPLVCGMFLGEDPIPLSGQWGVGGLRIEIQLAPDSNVLFSGTNSAAALLNAHYELSNVRLVCETEAPPPDQLSQLMSQTTNTFVYNSITSFYQTINSANATLNFNLALSKVLGVYMNVVPAAHINSLIRDGLATLPFTNADGSVAVVEQAVFTRGGERYPLQYNVDTLQKETPSTLTMDSQIARNYMNSVKAFAGNQRSSVDPTNFKYFPMTNNYQQAKDLTRGGSAFGLGVAYDSISDQGISFENVPFGLQLQLGLISNSPQAIFLFVHSKQTVVSTPDGIQVIR